MSFKKTPDSPNAQMVAFNSVVPGFVSDIDVQRLLEDIAITVEYEGISYVLVYRNGVFMRQTRTKPQQTFLIGYYDEVLIDAAKQTLLTEKLTDLQEQFQQTELRPEIQQIMIPERELALRKFSMRFRELFRETIMKPSFGRPWKERENTGGIRFFLHDVCNKDIPDPCKDLVTLFEKLGVQPNTGPCSNNYTLLLAQKTVFTEEELNNWQINSPLYKENMSSSPLSVLERSRLSTEIITVLRREVDAIDRKFYSPPDAEIAGWKDPSLFLLNNTSCTCKKCKPRSDWGNDPWSLSISFHAKPSIKITDEIIDQERKVPRLLRGFINP